MLHVLGLFYTDASTCCLKMRCAYAYSKWPIHTGTSSYLFTSAIYHFFMPEMSHIELAVGLYFTYSVSQPPPSPEGFWHFSFFSQTVENF